MLDSAGPPVESRRSWLAPRRQAKRYGTSTDSAPSLAVPALSSRLPDRSNVLVIAAAEDPADDG